MKTKELKRFMTSEEWKQEVEYIKIMSILKLIIQGLWIPFLYFMAIGYLIIFGLYIYLNMGYDYEVLKTCGSYVFGIIAFTWLNKTKFNIEKLRGVNNDR